MSSNPAASLEPSPSDPQWRTAYHEAGHGVVAMALNRRIERISIIPNSLRLGQCQIGKGRSREDWLEMEVLIMLGGMAAEARFTGIEDRDGARTDLLNVRRLLRSRTDSERQLERLEQRFFSKTEHLLDQESNWLAVQWIAQELVLKEVMSGRAALHFYERAHAEL